MKTRTMRINALNNTYPFILNFFSYVAYFHSSLVNEKVKNTPPRYTKLNVLLVIDEFEDQKFQFFNLVSCLFNKNKRLLEDERSIIYLSRRVIGMRKDCGNGSSTGVENEIKQYLVSKTVRRRIIIVWKLESMPINLVKIFN